MKGMWVFIVFGVMFLAWYVYCVWCGLDKSWAERMSQPDPECVTCNGWPVCMVYYTNGYYDVHFREPLCSRHLIQARKIVRLESELLDNPLPM